MREIRDMRKDFVKRMDKADQRKVYRNECVTHINENQVDIQSHRTEIDVLKLKLKY